MNWMQNPNFRLGLYVAIAGTTAIMATDGFSAKAVAGVLLQMFVAAKAFAVATGERVAQRCGECEASRKAHQHTRSG